MFNSKVPLILVVLICIVSCKETRNGGGNNSSTDKEQVATDPYYAPSPTRIAAVPDSSATAADSNYVNTKPASFVVTNTKDRQVRFYDDEGYLTYMFTMVGNPTAIAVSTQKEIYIGNKTTGKIDLYTFDGAYRYSFGDVKQPSEMALVESLDRLYVTDSKDHMVKAYDLSTKKLYTTFGKFGYNYGEFRFPTGIAVDVTRNKVIVGDLLNQRLQIFTLDGAFIKKISRAKKVKPLLIRPQGIDIDADGNFYVTGALWNGIYVFDANDQFVKVIGEFGSGSGQLKNPLDVLVTKSGTLLVSDFRNQRIEPLEQ